MITPLLSVCIITYNHKNYISKAIDSALNQITSFDYQIIIADDCSNDGTREILLAFKEKYPEKIELILQEKNIGPAKNWMDLLSSASSKYISYFEGDDYWSDMHKLQKQIDFLEENPDYNFSVGRVMHLNQTDGTLKNRLEFSELFIKPYLTIRDYLKSFFSQTSTYVFKREGFEFPSFCNHFHGEDILMVAVATKHGKIKFHDEVFSYYRIHPGGVTQKAQEWKMHYLDIYNYTEAIHILLDKKYKLLIQSIKLKLWLDYKVRTSSNRAFKYGYIIMGRINLLVKRYIL